MQVRASIEQKLATEDHQLVDTVAEWEQKAAEQYVEDGDADGWSSDSEAETAEQKYIKVSCWCGKESAWW